MDDLPRHTDEDSQQSKTLRNWWFSFWPAVISSGNLVVGCLFFKEMYILFITLLINWHMAQCWMKEWPIESGMGIISVKVFLLLPCVLLSCICNSRKWWVFATLIAFPEFCTLLCSVRIKWWSHCLHWWHPQVPQLVTDQLVYFVIFYDFYISMQTVDLCPPGKSLIWIYSKGSHEDLLSEVFLNVFTNRQCASVL